jgi:TRAP-type C4-dicarboxylate transport system permease small subunit
MATGLPKVSSYLHRLLVPVIFILGGVMFLIVLTQVIFRYVLSHPLPWSEESARYLMIWVTCLAASEAYAKGNHIGVTLIVAAVKPKMRKIMILAIHLIVAALCGFIAYEGFILSYLLIDQVSPALEVPMTWPYLAIPTAASLIFIQALALFFQQMREPPSSNEDSCEVK